MFSGVMFFVLSMLDLFLSTVAFSKGATEINPIMNAALQNGIFIPVKAGLSTILSIGIVVCNNKKLNIFAVSTMFIVLVWHLWGLTWNTEILKD